MRACAHATSFSSCIPLGLLLVPEAVVKVSAQSALTQPQAIRRKHPFTAPVTTRGLLLSRGKSLCQALSSWEKDSAIFVHQPSSVPSICCYSVAKSCPALLQPHGLRLSRFLCPWDSPGKNTGVVCLFLLQGISPTQGVNLHLLCLLHWQGGFFTTDPPGRPTQQRVNAK